MPFSVSQPGSWRNGIVVLISMMVLAVCILGSDWTKPEAPTQSNRGGLASVAFRSLQWRTIDDLPQPLAQYNTVFWEPRDTDSLRARIRSPELLRGKAVLEIGTGTGLVAICCLLAGSESVVATDVNPLAIANARHNAAEFGVLPRLDARLVSLQQTTAFAVIGDEERFDLIVSNPPWENSRPKSIDEYALYDPDFQLLHSLLSDGKSHLKPGGRIWLAYGCVEAIRVIQRTAPQHGWHVELLDDRRLDDLPEVFLPGMLLELTPET